MLNNPDLPIIIFDGYCNLCSSTVQFILKRDKKRIFRFVAMQSDKIILFKEKYSLDLEIPETVILIDGDKVFKRSEAVLRILKKLHFPLNLLWGLIIIPGFIRDPLYSWIAKNRYHWFGKRKSCFMPDDKFKDRFV
jgi:predicted DCC family thiol-disulfide oxidoreductase YuxK